MKPGGGGGAAQPSTEQGRSLQPNVLTIQLDSVTDIDFNRTSYNTVLDQLSSALEKGNFSSFLSSPAVALLYRCGKNACTRFPEGLIPLVVRDISFSNNDQGAMAIGTAVYGLQNLDGSDPSTHTLVSALAEKVRDSGATLDAQAIGNAVYGLKNLDGSDGRTHALVTALAAKVGASSARLSAQEIGNAVYGLQNLAGSDPSTHALVSALAEKVAASNATLSAQHIGNAVYGLQNLDGAHETTQALVSALSSRITGNATCSWGNISDCIVGVSNGDVDTWVAHAELIACAHKNPTLFRDPLGVKSLTDDERLYHAIEIHIEDEATYRFLTIDLHQHVPGSIAPYLGVVLQHDYCFSNWDRYDLVVGKGLHSQRRESALKAAVTSFFQGPTWNVEIDPDNSGRMRVSQASASSAKRQRL